MGSTKETLTKYLGDMHAVESHIYQAIQRQVENTRDQPEVNRMLRTFTTTLEQHMHALERRLEALGGSATQPVKDVATSVLGVAAGFIDKMRDEKVSKMFRDDYTALNLSTVSYVMLHTTALALRDPETADLALRHLEDNARFVMDINRFIPHLVVRDLSDDAPVDRTIVEQAVANTQRAWRSERPTTPQGTRGSTTGGAQY